MMYTTNRTAATVKCPYCKKPISKTGHRPGYKTRVKCPHEKCERAVTITTFSPSLGQFAGSNFTLAWKWPAKGYA